MKNKKLLYAVASIFSVIVVLAVFLVIWFWGDSYADFNSRTFKTEFDIPGLDNGYTPQGMTVYSTNAFTVKGEKGEDGFIPSATYEKDNYFFISSYASKGASHVYVIGEKTGYIGYVNLVNEDETEHTGHVGGVAINRDNLWVSSTRKAEDEKDFGVVYVAQVSEEFKKTNTNGYLYQEVIDKAAKSEQQGADNTIKFTAYFHAQGANDFLYYYHATNYNGTDYPSSSDRLYAGEFARKGDKTYENRHRVSPVVEEKDKNNETKVKTTGGDKNHAYVFEYRVYGSYTNNYSDYELGLYKESNVKSDSGYQVPTIQAIYSIPDDIQGFARTEDKLILSQSYSLKNSKIYCYDWDWESYGNNSNESELFKYEGVVNENSGAAPHRANLKVYFADSNSLARTYDIPSMSEGLCTLNSNGEERVYVLFESGAKKYKTFVRQILTNVYSFVPDKKY